MANPDKKDESGSDMPENSTVENTVLAMLQELGLSIQGALKEGMITAGEAEEAAVALDEATRLEKKNAKAEKTRAQEEKRAERLRQEAEKAALEERERRLAKEKAQREAYEAAETQATNLWMERLTPEFARKLANAKDDTADWIADIERRLADDEQRKARGEPTIENRYDLDLHVKNGRLTSRNNRAQKAAVETVEEARPHIEKWCRDNRSTAPGQYGWSAIDLGGRLKIRLPALAKDLEPLQSNEYERVEGYAEENGPGGAYMRGDMGDAE